MSASDALLNLAVTFTVMIPLSLLSWWIIRKTPLAGVSGVEKWRAYRIRVGAWSIILLSAGLMIYFMFHLIRVWP
jgi:hypothetical protein